MQVREEMKAMSPKVISSEKNQSVCSDWASGCDQLIFQVVTYER